MQGLLVQKGKRLYAANYNLNYQLDQEFLVVGLDFFDFKTGLAVSWKADGHNLFMEQSAHLGLRGVHTVCPNPT